MAVDYSILSRVPSIGSRIVSGMEAGREAAVRNQLLQQQQQDRAMQLQDRQRQMQQAQQQEAVFGQAADLIRKAGLDPDDPAVLQQFTAAAVQSRNPQLISLAGQMSERAQKRQQERAYRAEYERLYGGGAAAGTPAGMPPASPKITSTLIDQGARQPDVAPPAITAAQSFPVAPLAGTPTETPMAPTTNALAAAPTAAGANALAMPADPFAAQRAEAMEEAMSRNPYIAARGKLRLENMPKLEMPKVGPEKATPADLQMMQRLGYPLTQEGYTAYKSAGMRQPAEQAPILTEVQDPQNPQRMLKVDTRLYRRGGGIDSPGVIGVATKPTPGMTPAQETRRRDTLGKEFKTAATALQTTQDVLDSLTMVKESPGLARATGFTGVYTPSFSEGEAAQAETRLQNLRGKVIALGKAAAASSGAIGSIANQEWKILADQIAAIEPVKGKGPLLEQLALVEAQARGALERIRDAYQRTYGEDFERFPQFADLPAPKSVLKPKASAAQPAATQAPGGSIREQADAILGGGR